MHRYLQKLHGRQAGSNLGGSWQAVCTRGERYYPHPASSTSRRGNKNETVNADIAAFEGGAFWRKVMKSGRVGSNVLARNVLQEKNKGYLE